MEEASELRISVLRAMPELRMFEDDVMLLRGDVGLLKSLKRMGTSLSSSTRGGLPSERVLGVPSRKWLAR